MPCDRHEPDTSARRPGLTVFGCGRAEADLFHELGPRLGVRLTTTGEQVSTADLTSLPRHRCVSVGHTTEVSSNELLALRRAGVEYLCTRSVGTDHIDLDAARAIGIVVGNVRYAPDGVADFTLMLILMSLRAPTDALRPGDGRPPTPGDVRGHDLRDLTVGVVGTGPIGQAVIRRLHGFGCRVLAARSRSGRTTDAEVVELDELLALSDVVTLHLPHTADTHHLVGTRTLPLMRPHAVVVNTARGGLVDTTAMLDALERGQLGGAALDVLEDERELFAHPVGRPVPDVLMRLRRLPNVIVTPHVAYRTSRALHEIVGATLANCLTYERRRLDAAIDDRDLVRGNVGGT